MSYDLGIVVAAAIAITLNLIWQMGMAPPTALRQAAFQAVSLSSSTGFVSADFDTWPSFSKLVILGLMFIGGCGGSTAGGFKVTRVMLLCHMIREAVRQKIHPGVVVQVRSNHSEVSSDLILGVARFFLCICHVGLALDHLVDLERRSFICGIGSEYFHDGKLRSGFRYFRRNLHICRVTGLRESHCLCIHVDGQVGIIYRVGIIDAVFLAAT